jgi:hypothetical protein
MMGIHLLCRAQTGSGTTQPPIQWVLGVKRPGREASHSLPSRAEVKNAWDISSLPRYVSTAWCLIKQEIRVNGVHRDDFNSFYLMKSMERSP